MKRKSIIFFILSMIISLAGYSQQEDMILDFEIRILNNGEFVTNKGRVYYDLLSKKLNTHFTSPKDIYTLTDFHGNYKYYETDINSVMMKESNKYSSSKSMFYIFFNGKTQSLGYDEKGFELVNSDFIDGVLVTTWEPKNEFVNTKKIEIVYENNLPIFVASHNSDGVRSKLYYSNYELIYGYPIPMKTTEITFKNNIDSTITEKKYFNIQKGIDANYKIKNFEIPSNAKIIK